MTNSSPTINVMDELGQMIEQIQIDVPVHLFFTKIYELHSFVSFNSQNISQKLNINQHQHLQALISRIVQIHRESESIDNPELSCKAALKLNLMMLAVIRVLQFNEQFISSIEQVIILFNTIVNQDTSYFEIDDDVEQILELILQIILAELGYNFKNYKFKPYSFEIDKVSAEIEDKYTVFMDKSSVELTDELYNLKCDQTLKNKLIITADIITKENLDGVFQIIKYVSFNYSRLIYINNQRIDQLILGLELLNQIQTLSSDKDLYENIQKAFAKHITAPEILFIGNYFNPIKHNIFASYIKRGNKISQDIFSRIKNISIKIIIQTFKIQKLNQNQQLNNKLFNAHLCSNMQKYLEEILQEESLDSLYFVLDSESSFDPNFLKRTDFELEFVQYDQDFSQLLKEHTPKLYTAINHITDLFEVLEMNTKTQNVILVNSTTKYNNQKLVFDQKIVLPFQLSQLKYKELNQFAKNFKSINYDNIDQEQFKSDRKQHANNIGLIEKMKLKYTQNDPLIYETVQVVQQDINLKNIDDQKIKYFISFIQTVEKFDKKLSSILISMMFEKFTLENEADKSLVDSNLFFYLFSSELIFLKEENTIWSNYQQIYSQKSALNLTKTEYSQYLIAALFKIIEININCKQQIIFCLQILGFMLKNQQRLYRSLIKEYESSLLLLILSNILQNLLIDDFKMLNNIINNTIWNLLNDSELFVVDSNILNIIQIFNDEQCDEYTINMIQKQIQQDNLNVNEILQQTLQNIVIDQKLNEIAQIQQLQSNKNLQILTQVLKNVENAKYFLQYNDLLLDTLRRYNSQIFNVEDLLYEQKLENKKYFQTTTILEIIISLCELTAQNEILHDYCTFMIQEPVSINSSTCQLFIKMIFINDQINFQPLILINNSFRCEEISYDAAIIIFESVYHKFMQFIDKYKQQQQFCNICIDILSNIILCKFTKYQKMSLCFYIFQLINDSYHLQVKQVKQLVQTITQQDDLELILPLVNVLYSNFSNQPFKTEEFFNFRQNYGIDIEFEQNKIKSKEQQIVIEFKQNMQINELQCLLDIFDRVHIKIILEKSKMQIQIDKYEQQILLDDYQHCETLFLIVTQQYSNQQSIVSIFINEKNYVTKTFQNSKNNIMKISIAKSIENTLFYNGIIKTIILADELMDLLNFQRETNNFQALALMHNKNLAQQIFVYMKVVAITNFITPNYYINGQFKFNSIQCKTFASKQLEIISSTPIFEYLELINGEYLIIFLIETLSQTTKDHDLKTLEKILQLICFMRSKYCDTSKNVAFTISLVKQLKLVQQKYFTEQVFCLLFELIQNEDLSSQVEVMKLLFSIHHFEDVKIQQYLINTHINNLTAIDLLFKTKQNEFKLILYEYQYSLFTEVIQEVFKQIQTEQTEQKQQLIQIYHLLSTNASKSIIMLKCNAKNYKQQLNIEMSLEQMKILLNHISQTNDLQAIEMLHNCILTIYQYGEVYLMDEIIKVYTGVLQFVSKKDLCFKLISFIFLCTLYTKIKIIIELPFNISHFDDQLVYFVQSVDEQLKNKLQIEIKSFNELISYQQIAYQNITNYVATLDDVQQLNLITTSPLTVFLDYKCNQITVPIFISQQNISKFIIYIDNLIILYQLPIFYQYINNLEEQRAITLVNNILNLCQNQFNHYLLFQLNNDNQFNQVLKQNVQQWIQKLIIDQTQINDLSIVFYVQLMILIPENVAKAQQIKKCITNYLNQQIKLFQKQKSKKYTMQQLLQSEFKKYKNIILSNGETVLQELMNTQNCQNLIIEEIESITNTNTSIKIMNDMYDKYEDQYQCAVSNLILYQSDKKANYQYKQHQYYQESCQQDIVYEQNNLQQITAIQSEKGTITLHMDKKNKKLYIKFVEQQIGKIVVITNLISVIQTRYLFEWNSVELKSANDDCYLFKAENKTQVCALIDQISLYVEKNVFIRKINENNSYPVPQFVLDPITSISISSMWQRFCISNFDYLLILNQLAGRSINSIAHYPIMPWVISDFYSENIDLDDIQIYRDFSMPIGSQGLETKIRAIKNKFKESIELASYVDCSTFQSLTYEQIFGQSYISKLQIDPFKHNPFEHATINHHAYFYQTSAFVAHFLIRTHPEYALDIDKRIDKERGFVSIPGAFNCIQQNPQDNRELIPEFFNNPKIFEDEQKIGIGDVELPAWASNAQEFVQIHRAALESRVVSSNLHLWIDLIFGFRQQGKPAAEKMNLFGAACYESLMYGYHDEKFKQQHIQFLQNSANNFGHAPAVLFSQPHISRSINSLSKWETYNLNLKLEQQIIHVNVLENQLIFESSSQFLKVELKEGKNKDLFKYKQQQVSFLYKQSIPDVDYEQQTSLETGKIQYIAKNICQERNKQILPINSRCSDGLTVFSINFYEPILELFNSNYYYINLGRHPSCIDLNNKKYVYGCENGQIFVSGQHFEKEQKCIGFMDSQIISISYNHFEQVIATCTKHKVQLQDLLGVILFQKQFKDDIIYIKCMKNKLFIFSDCYLTVVNIVTLDTEKQIEHPKIIDISISNVGILLLSQFKVVEYNFNLEIMYEQKAVGYKIVRYLYGDQLVLLCGKEIQVWKR